MPLVVFYRDEDGSVPLLKWLAALPADAVDRCRALIRRLGELGSGMRRPAADTLTEGIHELRMKHHGINYRMLCFFHGRGVVVITHGFVKQRSRVPRREIDMAHARRRKFETDAGRHSHREA